ncbi:capsid maturation protease [Gordonia phage HannahD]|nr:capsid maturation protease [Gordonia phage HannahD]
MSLPAPARRVRALATTPDRRNWFEFRNAETTDTGPVEILIYDFIDPDAAWFGGVSARDFVTTLAQVDDNREINVRINSPGGDVYDGIAILNALRNRKSTVTTYVDGIAASIASIIAMAGTEVVMMPNAEMMIHDPWMVAIGNAKDLQEAVDNLIRVSDNLASVYADRTGGSADEWRAAMAAETWYSAEEAVTAGLADRIETPPKSGGKSEKAKTTDRFDLSIFAYAGRAAAPAPLATARQSTSAAEAEATREREEASMATLKEGLAERLGTDADADDETVLAAVDEALAERANDTDTDTDTGAGGQEQAPAAQLPDGVVTIDAATLSELQASARRGDQARAEQERNGRIAAVNAAVSAGRISPAQRDSWLDRLDKDPSEEAVLNSLAPVYPVSELGHGVGSESAGDPDPYEAIYGKDA